MVGSGTTFISRAAITHVIGVRISMTIETIVLEPGIDQQSMDSSTGFGGADRWFRNDQALLHDTFSYS